jgi:Fic family protein
LFNKKTDHLILIPLFILDYLCIHPHGDGNGRTSRLLTLLLLYKQGYEVGKFISLERIIEETKEGYYAALQRSSQGWHECVHDPMPWVEYFLGVLISAHREYVDKVENLYSGNKSERVRALIDKLPDKFSIGDITSALDDISRDTVKSVISELKRQGRLKSSGRGRSARLSKIEE